MTDQVDVEIGARVHAAMWRARITQAQLAKHLHLDGAAVSRRLRGTTAWKVSELLAVSQLLHVAAPELLPDAVAEAGDATATQGVTTHESRRRPGPRHLAARRRRRYALLSGGAPPRLALVTSGF